MDEEVVDAEIVLSKIEALQLVEDIRQLANNYVSTRDALLAKLEYARDTNAHEQIEGCKSYGDFIAHVFSGIPIKWSREDRRVLVADMAFHEKGGMSTRQIGKALGADHSTVVRDMNATGANAPVERQVSSSDGKTRTYTTTPQPEPDEPRTFTFGTDQRKASLDETGRVVFTNPTDNRIADAFRANPEKQVREAWAEATGNTSGTGNASRVRKALIANGEIPDSTPNRLAQRFDKIAHGLTYIADDLEKHLEDLDRAEPEDLEYGREFFEDAMTKLNHFRRKLNTKFA